MRLTLYQLSQRSGMGVRYKHYNTNTQTKIYDNTKSQIYDHKTNDTTHKRRNIHTQNNNQPQATTPTYTTTHIHTQFSTMGYHKPQTAREAFGRREPLMCVRHG